jgi:hypothetical protein
MVVAGIAFLRHRRRPDGKVCGKSFGQCRASLTSGNIRVIISLKYKFIYIRTRKTGSTTIHRTLAQCMGPMDIAIRGQKADLTPILRRGVEHPTEPFHTHVSAATIKPFIRRDIWKDSFKFTSERHPYEKAVSLAYFVLSKQDKIAKKRSRATAESFEALLDRVVNGGRYRSFDIYSIDGVPVVSDFIRQETLEADLKRIAERLEIDLPPASSGKTAHRQDRRSAREILSAAQKAIVYQKCRREFALLGYEP